MRSECYWVRLLWVSVAPFYRQDGQNQCIAYSQWKIIITFKNEKTVTEKNEMSETVEVLIQNNGGIFFVQHLPI